MHLPYFQAPQFFKNIALILPFQSLSDCREIYHNQENDGWIEYKYEAHFDPRWNGSDIDSEDEDDVPSFVTILSDPHTRFRYRQVVLVSAGNQGSVQQSTVPSLISICVMIVAVCPNC